MLTIQDVKVYEKNAKKHPDDQLELLARVVQEVGWRQNTEVNQDGIIIAGHGRYLAWKRFKEKYNLPEIWVTDDKGKTIHGEHATFPLTREQEEMWRIADNQINAMTGVDMKILLPTLKELSPEMLDLTGFTTLDLENPEKVDGEIPFTEELMEEHNYVVLYFDNTVDWLNLLSLYPIETVQSLDSKEGFRKMGVGRVIKGTDFINKLTKHA